MSHSVEQHLAVTPEAYDAEIRRFVFAYEEMIDEIGGAIVALYGKDAALTIVDLGAGTGALAASLAERLPRATFVLLDADPAMLRHAEGRLAAHRARASFECGSFMDPMKPCDVAVASLSLHHVHDLDAKEKLYANVRGALREKGMLFSADVTMPKSHVLADHARKRWAAHLVAHGDSEAQAYGRFEAWSKEDTYFSIEDELAIIRRAGFASAEILFRRGPSTVLTAVF
jgi:trans-aconitate methyltransferase